MNFHVFTYKKGCEIAPFGENGTWFLFISQGNNQPSIVG
jgi:hypothetical protein